MVECKALNKANKGERFLNSHSKLEVLQWHPGLGLLRSVF